MVLKTHRGKPGLLSSGFPVVYPRLSFHLPPRCIEAVTVQCLAFHYPTDIFKLRIVTLVPCDEKLRTQSEQDFALLQASVGRLLILILNRIFPFENVLVTVSPGETWQLGW